MRHARKVTAAVTLGLAATLALTACGGNGDEPSGAGAGANNGGGAAAEDVTLTWGGWDLDLGSEFRPLAEAFMAEHPGISIELVDYPNAEWAVAMTADLAAGSAPDIITLRNVTDLITWGEAGQLLDVTDIADGLDPETALRDVYQIDGTVYGVPYRADHWVLFYNKDLFREAGVDFPDGSWTWEDFNNAARELRAGLPDGVFPAYQHIWPSTVSAFAHTQTPGADLFSDDWSWLEPFYQWALERDREQLQTNFGSVTTGTLHHNAEFGQQRAAMAHMGTWFIQSMLNPEMNMDDFEWGMAPVPQFDESTTGANATPVTVGGPTGVAINAGIDGARVEAARTFLSWIAAEGGAQVLAERGQMTPLMT